jgi:hypothetical protein
MKLDDNQKNGQQDSVEIFSSMIQLSIHLTPSQVLKCFLGKIVPIDKKYLLGRKNLPGKEHPTLPNVVLPKSLIFNDHHFKA